MQRKSDYFMMALMLILSVGLIAAVSVSVGYATKAATREYEYEMLRKEYQERIEKEKEEVTTAINKLNERLQSESYVNTRRYELLSAEINRICIPAITELNKLKNKNNKE